MTSETNAPAMSVTASDDILHVAVTGEVRVEQVRYLRERMQQHPGFGDLRGVLFDFRDADLTRISADDIRWLASSQFTLRPDQKLAVVVTGRFGYGLARMFEQLRGERSMVRVFQDTTSARDWLTDDP